MSKFSFDAEAQEQIQRSDISSDHAAQALLVAAKYLRSGEPLPDNIADYLAGAIEAAMAKPSASRAKAFTDELGLTANNRRKVADWYEVGRAIEESIEGGKSEFNAILDASECFGISDGTAKNYLRQYRLALAEVSKIDDQEK